MTHSKPFLLLFYILNTSLYLLYTTLLLNLLNPFTHIQQLIHQIKSQTLESSLSDTESIVSSISNNLLELYTSQMCDSSSSCKRCSFHGCSNLMPNIGCQSKWTNSKELCKNCNGTNVNEEYSVFFYSNKYTTTDLTDNLVRQTICLTSNLDKLFRKNHLNSIDTVSNVLRWQYFGSSNGVFRIYPGSDWCGIDGEYNHKYRPWYVAGTTGIKNILVVLDSSNSMALVQKIHLAKETAKRFLEIVTPSDQIGFISIADNGKTVNSFSQILTNGYSNTIQKIVEFIDSDVKLSGKANLEISINKIYEYISNSNKESAIVPNSELFVVYITGGSINEGENNSNNIISIIKEKNSNLNNSNNSNTISISFFPVLINSNSDTSNTIYKAIACNNKGIFTNIFQSSDILNSIDVFYNSLIISHNSANTSNNINNNNNNNLSWSEPYIDGGGLGSVVTAVMPVYSDDTLLGVAASDIRTDDLLEFTNTNTIQKLTNFLISRTRKSSTKNNLSDCELNQLRGETSQCDTSNNGQCHKISFLYKECSTKKLEILCGNEKELTVLSTLGEDYKCCVVCSVNNTVAIVIPILIVLIIILVFIILYFKYKIKADKKRMMRDYKMNIYKYIVMSLFNKKKNLNLNKVLEMQDLKNKEKRNSKDNNTITNTNKEKENNNNRV